MRLPNLPADQVVVNPDDGRATDGWFLHFEAVVRWLKSNGGTIYGTAAQRTTATTRGYVSPGSVADGTLYIESDTGKVYQMRAGAWVAVDMVLGASGLTNDGRLTMVSATDGTISESAVTDNGTSIAVANREVAIAAVRALAKMTNTGQTTSVRIGADAAAAMWSVNLSFDGTNWNLDDTSKTGWLAYSSAGILTFYTAAAAANPATLVQIARIDAAGHYYVGANQVVGARGAALTASAAAGNAAGVAYLQADAATWVTLMNNLRTRVLELEARLSSAAGHGLIT